MSQLFCLPYAGGSGWIYRDWCDTAGSDWSIVPLEYAGHGKRFSEDCFQSIEEAGRDAAASIAESQTGDFVIYGHSMGSLVALEAAYVLQEKSIFPKAVIVAANRPPHLAYKDKALEKLTKDELMSEIASLGQIEKEVFDNKDLYDIIADIMYSDIQMFREYKKDYSGSKLCIPMMAISGKEDRETPAEDMMEWQYYTTGPFSAHVFEGDHFFAFHDRDFPAHLEACLKVL